MWVEEDEVDIEQRRGGVEAGAKNIARVDNTRGTLWGCSNQGSKRWGDSQQAEGGAIATVQAVATAQHASQHGATLHG